MRISSILLALIITLGIQLSAPADEILSLDFEQGADPAKIERLSLGKMEAAIAPGGPNGKGHCLQIANRKPSTSCGLRIRGPIAFQKNLVLAFDHREEIEEGYEGAYLGMIFYVDGKQWFFARDQFSSKWRHVEVPLGRLRGSGDQVMHPGLVFSGIQLYGRVKHKANDRARITVRFDNIRIFVGQRKPALSERTRTSNSNPPLFNWSNDEHPGGRKLQYSADPSFPADDAVTVEVKSNFFTPEKPLKPGTWYWRVMTESQLCDDWSDAETIVVPANVHRFATRPVPIAELIKTPRPRLLPVAKLGRPELTDEYKATLVKTAQSIFKRGVPEHPGPHVEGDPRWPTWIDWYGKVAGGITGRTGRRLQRIAACAMLTGDPQVIDWTKQLALEACKWDPDGGSAMRRGDIGAHYLLRGLNWCYDACWERMSEEERNTLRGIIVRRAEQFQNSLNPFRGGEANNHAWLRAFGLAESGIVLAGDFDRAGEWIEYVRQLYLGRFLCCLGYQGDNNEGIAYWSYGLMFIVDYADMMKAVCHIDLYKHPWLNQTARFPMYCAPPNAWGVSFADSGKPNHGVRGPAQTKRVADLAIRTRDPYALWYGGAREPVDGLTPKPPTDLPQSIHYRHIGWVIFNTSLVDGLQGSTVAMHSGRYYAGHQHPDQNSFVINAYGEKLAIDGGYYDWWGSPHFKAYSMTTLAHNTLLVDGQGQADRKKGADGRVAQYFDSPGYGYTLGDASKPEIYAGKLKQFDRRILFIKPGFVLVHDMVASADKPARFDWLLHAIVPIETDARQKSFVVPCENAALRGRFLSPPDVGLAVKTGFPVEPVDGYSTRPVPPEKYFAEWILSATPKSPSVSTEFLAAMQIQRLGESAEPSAVIESIQAENAHGVSLNRGDATHLVLFRKHAAKGPIRAGQLVSDGDVAAVELTADGQVKRAMAIGATYLRHAGEDLSKWLVGGSEGSSAPGKPGR